MGNNLEPGMVFSVDPTVTISAFPEVVTPPFEDEILIAVEVIEFLAKGPYDSGVLG